MFFRELYGDILHNQHIPLNRDPLLEAHVGSSNTETQGLQRIKSFVVIFTSCHHSFQIHYYILFFRLTFDPCKWCFPLRHFSLNVYLFLFAHCSLIKINSFNSFTVPLFLRRLLSSGIRHTVIWYHSNTTSKE